MNETVARELLKGHICADNSLKGTADAWAQWCLETVLVDQGNGIEEVTPKTVGLDGDFTADQLRAFAWWIENKNLQAD